MMRISLKYNSLVSKSLVLSYDVFMGLLALFLAIVGRYFFKEEPVPHGLLIQSLLFFSFACLFGFVITRQYRAIWRFSSLDDVLKILLSTFIINFIFLLVLFIFNRAYGFPRSSLLIEIPLFFSFMLVARLLRVAWTLGDWRSLLKKSDPNRPWALVIGRLPSLNRFLRDYKTRKENLPYRIYGLVEYTGAHIGQTIQGLKVLGGMKTLGDILDGLGIKSSEPPYLVLTDAKTEKSFIRKILRLSSGRKARLIRYHPEQSGALSPFEVADLIGRIPKSIDLRAAQDLVKDKTVFITGAGGTIGSEITRQIARLRPQKMVLLDSSELALYTINQELEADGSVPWSIHLADIRDQGLLQTLMKAEKPDIIFHAAALKHVPLMEKQPIEAIKTNIEGTLNLANVALANKVHSFILISTDKAVDPENIMGATKRFAELYILSLAKKHKNFRASAVRFGNVLGSTGSVIPLFEKQISEGGPVTVTHAEMTRFFMTKEEAVSLVLQTAVLTDTEPKSTLYVLDMGNPISIMHLARQLIRLRGFEPESEIKIKISGLRPGEKVHEEVVSQKENMIPSKIKNILQVRTCALSFEEVSQEAHWILHAVHSGNHEKLVDRLFNFVQKEAYRKKEKQKTTKT